MPKIVFVYLVYYEYVLIYQGVNSAECDGFDCSSGCTVIASLYCSYSEHCASMTYCDGIWYWRGIANVRETCE